MIRIYLFFLALIPWSLQAEVKNVILFIGDGMGDEHIKAAGSYFYGSTDLAFTRFPVQGIMQTSSYGGLVTDSAAAATAMATGVKTNNGMIGRGPDGEDLNSITYLSRLAGKSTGIVTDVSISHATPAGFSAHADSREQLNRIVDSMLSRSRPHLIMGGALEINADWASYKGYSVFDQIDYFRESLESGNLPDRISGQFGSYQLPWADGPDEGLPRLSDLVVWALEYLTAKKNEAGFFLMVEAGKIDWAAHQEDLYRVVHEVKALEDAVVKANEFLAQRQIADTLVIVTADHETGGLKLKMNEVGPSGILPSHQWTGPGANSGNVGHTGEAVRVFAKGPGAQLFEGEYENTEIFHKIKELTLTK